MTRKLQIECVAKTDRREAHARLTAVGGSAPGGRWKHKQADAILWIKDGTFAYHVLDGEGKETKVVVAEGRNGQKYLKTEADNEQPDNLLKLPECP